MEVFNINVWYRYGKDHDEQDFITEEIVAENKDNALSIVAEMYKKTKIIPFKIELVNYAKRKLKTYNSLKL